MSRKCIMCGQRIEQIQGRWIHNYLTTHAAKPMRKKGV